MTSATRITVRVPLRIHRRPGRKTVVTPVLDDSGVAIPTRADPALVKALARAFRYQKLLDEGRYASISEMAAAEHIERGYLGSLLRLTLLAPDIVKGILDRSQALNLDLSVLLNPLPPVWADQQRAFASQRLPRPLPARHGQLAMLAWPGRHDVEGG